MKKLNYKKWCKNCRYWWEEIVKNIKEGATELEIAIAGRDKNGKRNCKNLS